MQISPKIIFAKKCLLEFPVKLVSRELKYLINKKKSETNSFMTTIKVKIISSYFVVVFIKL